MCIASSLRVVAGRGLYLTEEHTLIERYVMPLIRWFSKSEKIPLHAARHALDLVERAKVVCDFAHVARFAEEVVRYLRDTGGGSVADDFGVSVSHADGGVVARVFKHKCWTGRIVVGLHISRGLWVMLDCFVCGGEISHIDFLLFVVVPLKFLFARGA